MKHQERAAKNIMNLCNNLRIMESELRKMNEIMTKQEQKLKIQSIQIDIHTWLN